ncbi:hypothetical protein D3C87_105310 [compost metagenome]
MPKEQEPGKALNTVQRSDIRLYGKSHIVKLRADVEKLMANTTGFDREHYQNIILEIDKIISKLNKTDA